MNMCKAVKAKSVQGYIAAVPKLKPQSHFSGFYVTITI